VPYPSRNELGNTKIVIDMSSDFLMKKIKWENVDLAFSCTSKNMGIAGACVLIIRENLLNELQLERNIPYILDWNLYNKTNSLFNTPAIFNIYLLEHILDSYISDFENIENMNKNTLDKSKLVYEFLDNNNKFKPVVLDIRSRSNINIPFIVDNGNEETMIKFLEYCYKNNIVGLRTKTPFNYKDLGIVEPLRVSLYNGISINDTKHLINTMSEFIKLI
jgi:phosphoserine aminotransferase